MFESQIDMGLNFSPVLTSCLALCKVVALYKSWIPVCNMRLKVQL